MRIGEIWQDKEDGSQMKIVKIEYNDEKSDNWVWLEDYPEKDHGYKIHRLAFLDRFEKIS